MQPVTKIRVLIVDDEALARERIRSLLNSIAGIEIVGECSDGVQAVDAIHTLNPDLVFLDVQMPEMDGFAVVSAVGVASMPTVIFVTAYDDYAIKAFEIHALDYLLKPFDRERFTSALERAQSQIRQERSSALSHRLLTLLDDITPERKPLERIVIKSGGRVFFLKSDEIDWVEAAGNYVKLHTSAQAHLLRETMNSIEAQLDRNRFARIHRSFIVNIERIRELNPLFHGDYSVKLEDGTELTLSRTYRSRLQETLGHQF